MDSDPYKSPQGTDPGADTWLAQVAAYFGLTVRYARCSFCGAAWEPARPLAEGVDRAYICRDCVEHCAAILDSELVRLSRPGALKPSPPRLRINHDRIVRGALAAILAVSVLVAVAVLLARALFR